MNLLNRTVDFLIEQDCIKEEERTLYMYGLQLVGLYIINISISILLGAAFGLLKNVLLFLLLFIPLRSFAGGYHAKSPVFCAVLSQAVILAAGSVSRLFSGMAQAGILCEICFLVFGLIQIVRYAPGPAETKPLDKIEKIQYRTVALVLTGIESAILVVAFLTGWYSVVAMIACVMFIEGILLTIGRKSYVQ